MKILINDFGKGRNEIDKMRDIAGNYNKWKKNTAYCGRFLQATV